MDTLLESLGRLLWVFKEPTQVLMLLIIFAETFGIYKLVIFFLDRLDKDRDRDIKTATALEGLTAIIKEKMSGK